MEKKLKTNKSVHDKKLFKQPNLSVKIGEKTDGIIQLDEETTSVGDLIKFLQQYPENVPVLGAWEGQEIPIYGAYVNDSFVCENYKPVICLLVDSDYSSDLSDTTTLYP